MTLDGADELVVLGGAMDFDETDAYPHLARTMDLLADAAAIAPALGICLGAQLAAAALGGRAYPGPAGEEIGWTKVELTDAGEADQSMGALQEPAELFEWHHDTFDPPPARSCWPAGPSTPARRSGWAAWSPSSSTPRSTGPCWPAGGPGPPRPPTGAPVGEVMARASRNAANATRLLEGFCRVAAGAWGTMPA